MVRLQLGQDLNLFCGMFLLEGGLQDSVTVSGGGNREGICSHKVSFFRCTYYPLWYQAPHTTHS